MYDIYIIVEIVELYRLYDWFDNIHSLTKGDTVDRKGNKFKSITPANLKQFLLNVGICVFT